MFYAKRRVTRTTLLCIFAVLALTPWQQAKASGLYTFSSHTFTPCGATGWTGPTLLNCTTGAYVAQTWTGNTSNFNVVAGIQYWTVPATGSYTIAAAGAKGGGNGGLGAIETGTFSLTQGAVIRILVGQAGALFGYGSGGGGTFVVASPYNSNASILVIGGGGGGFYSGTCSVNAGGQTTPSPIGGTQSAASGGGGGGSTQAVGGVGFTNGGAVGASTYAGGGAGFGGDGGRYRSNLSASGLSFINGGKGGEAFSGAQGGFGGGGGIGDRPGGGGGYSGGNSENTACGIGGGSYNSGSNTSEVANRNNGAGYVSIVYNAPSVSSLNLNLSVGGNVAVYRTTAQIAANVSTNGRVTFFQNGKRIGGCINIQSNSLVAYCNWRATNRGAVTLTARLAPNADFLPSTSTAFNVLVGSRSTMR
jgi:hypothetical protein